jgi:hypothetical protein
MSGIVLTTLAASINAEHAQAQAAAGAAVEHARRCGELLIEAKSKTNHGEWLPWLMANCPDIAERTAQAYMRVARACLSNPDTATKLRDGTVRGALEHLTQPKSATVADLPPWSGDDVSWLPKGDRVAFLFGDDGDDSRMIAVWESEEHAGYYHLIQVYPGDVVGDTGGMLGNYRPALADAMTMIVRQSCGLDPIAIEWEYSGSRRSLADIPRTMLRPKWMQGRAAA